VAETKVGELHIKIGGDAEELTSVLGGVKVNLKQAAKVAEEAGKKIANDLGNNVKSAASKLDNYLQVSSRVNAATTLLKDKFTQLGQRAKETAKDLSTKFGSKVQQAGYQVQDFVVQVQGGTSALVAFGQQGSQLAGAFGPKGAVIGAVIALGSAIAGLAVKAFSAKTDIEGLMSAAERVRGLRFDMLTQGAVALEKFADEADRVKAQDILTKMQRDATIAANAQREYNKALKEHDEISQETVGRGFNTRAKQLALEEKKRKSQQRLLEAEAKVVEATKEVIRGEEALSSLISDNTSKIDERAEALKRAQEAAFNASKSSFTGGSIFGAVGTEAYAMQLEQDAEFLAERQRMFDEAGEMRNRAAKNFADYELWVERQRAKATTDFMDNMVGMMNSKSRKLFEIGKIAAASRALVSGYEEVSFATKWGMNIGGPPLAAAFGAAAAASVATRLQQINSAKFGGGGGSGAISFNGSGQEVVRTETQVASINIVGGQGATFSGDQIRGLIGAINDAVGDGVQLRTN
jgi:hypothetical protein